MSLIDRFLNRIIRHGTLELTDHQGRTRSFGTATPGFPDVAIRLADKDVASFIALHPRLGAGEAYMDGRLIIERGDIMELIVRAVAAGCNLIDTSNHYTGGASEAADDADSAATAMGADGAELGASRKRAAENAPLASDPEQRCGKKAKHAAKRAAARSERIEKSAEADDGGYALKAKGQAQREGVVFAVAKAGEEGRTGGQ